jgi:hypothetical protein
MVQCQCQCPGLPGASNKASRGSSVKRPASHAGATFASLALGRFVFLPFQRDNAKKQVGRKHA